MLRSLVNLGQLGGHSIPSSAEAIVVGVLILLGVAADDLVKRRSATKYAKKGTLRKVR